MTGDGFIQRRLDTQGAARYRAVVHVRGKQIRGSWTLLEDEAESDRLALVARRSLRRTRQDVRGRIYFMQVESGAIKIGFTGSSAERRLKHVQTHNHEPVVLISTRAGNRRDELALHRRFGKHRIHGEWFRPHQDVLAAASA